MDRKIMMDPEEEGKHLVLPGEDLEHLSQNYGTSPEAFIKRNRYGKNVVNESYKKNFIF